MALLDLDAVREHVTTTLGDDALQRIVDACESDITRRAGPLVVEGDPETADEVTETVYRRGRSLLDLTQEPEEVISVTDISGTTETDLDVDDWRIRGTSLERAGGYWWGDRTTVVYRPMDTRSIRIRTLIKLVQLDLNHDPGIGTQRAGEWSRSAGASYQQERESILSDLAPQVWFA